MAEFRTLRAGVFRISGVGSAMVEADCVVPTVARAQGRLARGLTPPAFRGRVSQAGSTRAPPLAIRATR